MGKTKIWSRDELVGEITRRNGRMTGGELVGDDHVRLEFVNTETDAAMAMTVERKTAQELGLLNSAGEPAARAW